MATVVSIQEGRGKINSTTKIDSSNMIRVTATRVFFVQFREASPANQLEAKTASWTPSGKPTITIPAVGEGFSPEAPLLTAREISAVPVGPLLYEVVVGYGGDDSPLQAPWEFDLEDVESAEEVSADVDGVAYADPLGLPQFGTSRRVTDRVYIITRNEASNVNCRDRTWLDKVNSEQISLAGKNRPAKTVRMDSVKGKQVVAGTNYYWRITYRMTIREPLWGIPEDKVWYRRRLCYSNYYWDGTYNADNPPTKHLVACTGDDGVTLCPRKLKADGTLLPAGEDDVFLYTKEYEEISFSTLGLV